ncbi:MAG: hypothetical protein EZS28_014215 [Streblomastix strix]|uniref:Uncharacterized protein n=1 Tax=Streblomastix strix TaxID=222440 RepID=A0A5J4W714_9EUKA|nr:MAG: hypothetical protein EZS28_014215 [Streblomastix strix]
MLRCLQTRFEAGNGQETVKQGVIRHRRRHSSAEEFALKEMASVSIFVAYYNAFERHYVTETLHANSSDLISISKLSLIPFLKAQKTLQSQAQHISVGQVQRSVNPELEEFAAFLFNLISIRRFSKATMTFSCIMTVKSTHTIHPDGQACKNLLFDVNNSKSL